MSSPEQPADHPNESGYVWPDVDPADAALVAEVLAQWQSNERPNQQNMPAVLMAEVLHLWARSSSNAAAALGYHAKLIREYREGWGSKPADTVAEPESPA